MSLTQFHRQEEQERGEDDDEKMCGLDVSFSPCPVFFTAPTKHDHLWEDSQPGSSKWKEETQTEFSPEVSTESGQISYSFRCPSSGTFYCLSTGLVFDVTKEAELQYRIVQWDETLLQSSGRSPAGPLYDIECPERAVCELHLPHCEPENADLSQSQLSVAHISDTGLSLIEPQRITETHVVIPVSGLSTFGLVWRWLTGQPHPVRGQVLLFRTPSQQNRKLKMNMFLLPRSIPVDQVKCKQGNTTQYIRAPSNCQLVIDQHYSVLCPSAQLVQPKRAKFEMDNKPNYHPSFELWLSPESPESPVFITVREEGSSEESGVWTYCLDLTEPSLSRDAPSSSCNADPETLLHSVRSDFIEGVSDPVLDQLLDLLLEERVLTSQEMETIKEKPRAEKARQVVDSVIMKGAQAASVLIRGICQLDPRSRLCERLSSNPSTRPGAQIH